jgi:hypothetical protein
MSTIDDNLKFKREVCQMTTVIDVVLLKMGIPVDITTVAALKLLARIYEVTNENPISKKPLRDITFGEMEDASKRISDMGMQELDFILADKR